MKAAACGEGGDGAHFWSSKGFCIWNGEEARTTYVLVVVMRRRGGREEEEKADALRPFKRGEALCLCVIDVMLCEFKECVDWHVLLHVYV